MGDEQDRDEKRADDQRRVDEPTARNILELAARMDEEMGTHIPVAQLRAAARDAGISNEAFDRALEAALSGVRPPVVAEQRPTFINRLLRGMDRVLSRYDRYVPRSASLMRLLGALAGGGIFGAVSLLLIEGSPPGPFFGVVLFTLMHLFCVQSIGASEKTRLAHALALVLSLWTGVWAGIFAFDVASASNIITLGALHFVLSVVVGLLLLALRSAARDETPVQTLTSDGERLDERKARRDGEDAKDNIQFAERVLNPGLQPGIS